MKFARVLMVTGLSAWGWAAAAAPEGATGPALKTPDKPIAEWVRDLSNEQFRVRETATRKIWERGDEALSALQEAANGKDPETAYRARELIRKIELHLTPDTDPEVMGMVERYAKASADDKQMLLGQMQRKRAWRQILKLFANEKDTRLLRQIQGTVDEVAVLAARECLMKGDAKGAREYLEMAPATPAGLVSLADFHRSQGTLDAELKRAKTLKGESGEAWQLALYRASGNVEAARDAAMAAGEVRISAAMSLLLGDPVPWMRTTTGNREEMTIHKPYTELAIKRWQGKKLLAADLEPLVKALGSANPSSRVPAINSLFLLGEGPLAEGAYAKASPTYGFLYYELLERVPKALEAYGLDPEKPDYPAWVGKRLERLAREEGEQEERLEITPSEDLRVMANFMSRRGLTKEFDDAYKKPLLELAEKDEKAFTDLMALLFGNQGIFSGAPEMAGRVAAEWAGESGERWNDVLVAAFGEDDDTTAMWDWMSDLDPKASRQDRFEGLLAMSGMGDDPQHLREKWLKLGWKAVDETPEGQREPLFQKMAIAIGLQPDVENNLKLWDMYPKEKRDSFFPNSHISELTIAGRWDDAADFFLKQIDRVAKLKLDPSPVTHASAAACLRKAGRMAEAAEHDEWVDKLALGRDGYQIAAAYQFGDDYARSEEWYERAVRLEDPTVGGAFDAALEEHGTRMLEQGRWKEAAAIFEEKAQMEAGRSSRIEEVGEKVRYRLQADLARALANLKTDRSGSLALLEHCYQMFPGDGTLADFFFPSLRKVGLISEHDAWFKQSWDRMTAVAKAYPGCSNTLNTTGWLGARAMRNLDESQDYLERALALEPNEANYLDTMAEIQFGKGNRAKALEWSARAVNFTPGSDDRGLTKSFLLRRQHEHFRSDPLPK